MLRIECFVSLAYFLFYLVPKVEASAAAAAIRDGTNGTAAPTYFSVNIGVILDSNSSMGAMENLCISMARSDFYALHPDYRTRLVLQTKYAQDNMDVASAALELIKNDEVHAILGTQIRTDDKLIVELGRKARVPVISFTDKGHPVSYSQSPYFIQIAPDDSCQAKALASICQRFEWQSAIFLYEDTDDGVRFLSKLKMAFQKADICLDHAVAISKSAEDQQILKELKNLTAMQTARVFVVHMNYVLGSRLFLLAKNAGMMSKGYAWIVTDKLGNFINFIDPDVLDSMVGVLGLRPHAPKSKNLDNFRTRWKMNMFQMKPESTGRELNVLGFWAYDTIWALALAVEKIGPVNPGFLEAENSKTGSGIFNLRLSQFGQKLVRELQTITFDGLTGEFQLVDRQLKHSSLEIFNVLETKEKAIGYWKPDQGITPKLKSNIWPGDTKEQPKGSCIRKLKVGVPLKGGFTEFVNVLKDPQTNKNKFDGFSIQVFNFALKLLNLSDHCHYILSNDTSYDALIQKVGKDFDMVVGDVTILADRAKYVDFTLPYSESGTVMVVKVKKERDIWSFVKPFRWDLWLTIISTCTFIGIVLQILEHRANNDDLDAVRPQEQQLGLLFWFPIAVLAFPERNMVASPWSKFVLILWVFMAYIIMQSYTANLSAMYTVDQLNFRFSNDYNIGCQKGAFVKNFLINRLHVNESKIKEYSTVEEYHDAMSKGSKNGGIDVIFDEIPYMKLLLDRYDSEYEIVGTTYRTDGLAFAFPLRSQLVANFSKAILELTEGPDMYEMEQRYFRPKYSSYNLSDPINKQSSSLSVFNFGGLFIIIASALTFALVCSETSVGRRFTDMVTQYSHRCFLFPTFQGNESRVVSIVHPESWGDLSSEEEQGVDGSDQLNLDYSSNPSLVHESDQRNADISATDGEANESGHSNSTRECQLSEQRNISVSSAREISS